MERVAFLLILSVGQILECQSFEFRNLFGSYSADTSSYSSSNIQASSVSTNNLLDSDERLENASFSFIEDVDEDYNASIASINELLDSYVLQQENTTNESLMGVNVMDTVLNHSENHINVPNKQPVTSTEEPSSVINHTSIASAKASSQDLNKTDSIPRNITTTEEPEEVVLGDDSSTFTFVTKTIYKKTVDFMGDPYTLSIFVPIAAGVLFALTIILTIATCRCVKKKCRRRRFRKRVLPDSIKNLRPSDQARLLGDCCDSSDEF